MDFYTKPDVPDLQLSYQLSCQPISPTSLIQPDPDSLKMPVYSTVSAPAEVPTPSVVPLTISMDTPHQLAGYSAKLGKRKASDVQTRPVRSTTMTCQYCHILTTNTDPFLLLTDGSVFFDISRLKQVGIRDLPLYCLISYLHKKLDSDVTMRIPLQSPCTQHHVIVKSTMFPAQVIHSRILRFFSSRGLLPQS